MTAPDTTPASAEGNVDAPTATVGIGPSEIVAALALISSLLTMLFGQDWGIAKNAQALAALGVVLIPVALSIARSIKHHGAAHANAAVYVAQLQAIVAASHVADGVTPAGLAAGVSALNTAVNADLATPSEGDAAP